jgi:hypothetical protein
MSIIHITALAAADDMMTSTDQVRAQAQDEGIIGRVFCVIALAFISLFGVHCANSKST